MENINMSIKDNILTITVDLCKEGRLSSSGKSIVIATTKGNQDIGVGGIKAGINIYKKA
jgi:hypothetical protein